MPFLDRVDAGRRLGQRLLPLRGDDVVVLGLPRGGVPVAYEVAKALGAPLDVIVVRKLGVPHQPELAMGAVGENGVRVLESTVLRRTAIDEDDLAAVTDRERVEVQRRARRFRGDRPPLSLAGRTAIVVDDGIATGSTTRAACKVARALGARRIVLAVPVAAQDALDRLRLDADEVICLLVPRLLYAVGQWYTDFAQVTDDEVVATLARAHEAAGEVPAPRHGTATEPPSTEPLATGPPSSGPPSTDEEIELAVGEVTLAGRLTVPRGATGLILFAHGSGSSRHSPRNRFVAARLNEAGLGTLLFDLLTSEEERDRARVFDIELLAGRLAGAARQMRDEHRWIGYFGASTGAAAALWAATEPDAEVGAVVSRGGRPDLAGPRLALVTAPTLLIVGGRDQVVLDLNRQARDRLRCPSELAVVPGATHLFEEPGALARVAELAAAWFTGHAAPVATGPPDRRAEPPS